MKIFYYINSEGRILETENYNNDEFIKKLVKANNKFYNFSEAIEFSLLFKSILKEYCIDKDLKKNIGEKFYYIDSELTIQKTKYRPIVKHFNMIKIGNWFKIKEHAELTLGEMKARRD